MINLWNPSSHLSFLTVLITAVLLGMIHGITPDEHTWPITFSYSIGSYSTKGGMRAGFLFSAAFTLQRAIASEIAYVIMSQILFLVKWEPVVYMIVGVLMALSGVYILRLGEHLHFLAPLEKGMSKLLRINQDTNGTGPRSSPVRLALLHGFVAGWGTGAFAIIVYTVLSPQMPSVYVGFLPGLFFGLGTMVMQIVLGGLIGFLFSKLHIPTCAIPYVAKRVAGMILTYGGLAFLIVGALELVTPIANWQWQTNIHVHNLDTIGIGFFLAVVVLFGVAVYALLSSLKLAKEKDFCSHRKSSSVMRAD